MLVYIAVLLDVDGVDVVLIVICFGDDMLLIFMISGCIFSKLWLHTLKNMSVLFFILATLSKLLACSF